LTPERAPDGFMARGSYKGKVLFVDHDGIVHMQFEYYFDIAKEWK
jgi:Rho GDP-dissociation inhibitor